MALSIRSARNRSSAGLGLGRVEAPPEAAARPASVLSPQRANPLVVCILSRALKRAGRRLGARINCARRAFDVCAVGGGEGEVHGTGLLGSSSFCQRLSLVSPPLSLSLTLRVSPFETHALLRAIELSAACTLHADRPARLNLCVAARIPRTQFARVNDAQMRSALDSREGRASQRLALLSHLLECSLAGWPAHSRPLAVRRRRRRVREFVWPNLVASKRSKAKRGEEESAIGREKRHKERMLESARGAHSSIIIIQLYERPAGSSS